MGASFFFVLCVVQYDVMEQEILNRLQAQDELMQKVYVSVEKTRKYLMWTGIITLALIILPIIALMFVIPMFISSYSSMLNF